MSALLILIYLLIYQYQDLYKWIKNVKSKKEIKETAL